MPFQGVRLRDLRTAKGLSQEELERLSGVCRSTVAKCELGKAKPSADTLRELANALDATMDYFYVEERDPDPGGSASRMAYEVFAKDPKFTVQQRERCARALSHRDAPRTADAWKSFAEMVDVVIGGSRQIELVPKPRT